MFQSHVSIAIVAWLKLLNSIGDAYEKVFNIIGIGL